MQRDQGPDHRQPHPEAPVRAGQRVVSLHERLEDAVQEGGFDPHPLIAHGEHHALAGGVPLEPHAHRLIGLRELERVREQVAQDLRDPHPIGMHQQRLGGGRQLQGDVGGAERLQVVADDLAGQRHDVHRLAQQIDLPPGDPGDIEQVVEQAGHVSHLPVEDVARARGHLLGNAWSPEQVGGVEHGAERVAQLVGQHGQELVLALVGLPERQHHLTQLLLRPPPLGDVPAHPDQPLGHTGGTAQEAPVRFHPAHLAGRADDPVDDVVVGAFLDRPGDGRQDARAILGVDVALVGLEGAGEATGLEPVDLFQHRRPGDLPRGDVPVPRPQPPRLERDPQVLLRAGQLVEQVGVVDGGGGASGDLFHKPEIGRLEWLGSDPGDGHHSEDGGPGNQRDDHRRAHRVGRDVVAERRAGVRAHGLVHVDLGNQEALPTL
jgi:hypothetical protein